MDAPMIEEYQIAVSTLCHYSRQWLVVRARSPLGAARQGFRRVRQSQCVRVYRKGVVTDINSIFDAPTLMVYRSELRSTQTGAQP